MPLSKPLVRDKQINPLILSTRFKVANGMHLSHIIFVIIVWLSIFFFLFLIIMGESLFLLLGILGSVAMAYMITPLVYCERRSKFFTDSILAYIQPNYGIKSGIIFEYADILEFKPDIQKGAIWLSINKGKFKGGYWIGFYTPDELNKVREILLSKGVYETMNHQPLTIYDSIHVI